MWKRKQGDWLPENDCILRTTEDSKRQNDLLELLLLNITKYTSNAALTHSLRIDSFILQTLVIIICITNQQPMTGTVTPIWLRGVIITACTYLSLHNHAHCEDGWRDAVGFSPLYHLILHRRLTQQCGNIWRAVRSLTMSRLTCWYPVLLVSLLLSGLVSVAYVFLCITVLYHQPESRKMKHVVQLCFFLITFLLTFKIAFLCLLWKDTVHNFYITI